MSPDPLAIATPLFTGVAALHLGVFVCADTALTALGPMRLSALATHAKPRYRKHLERAARLQVTVQARYLAWRALSLCVTAGSTVLWLRQLDLPPSSLAASAFGALLVLAVIVELSASLGRRAVDTLLPPLLICLRPYELVIAPLAFLTGGFTYLLKWRRTTDPKVTEAEVELIVDQGERAGTIEQGDAELIRNVLEFSDRIARDAMVPRTKVVAIKVDTPFEDWLQTVTESGHSRYPVYEHDMDDVFGLVYAKDLFPVVTSSWRAPPISTDDPDGTPSQRSAQLLDIVREPVKFVSETTPLPDLLRAMRHDRQHLAVVVDEFGGTSGIVTLEDVLEEIVGDIQDEYDQEEAPIVDLGQGRLIVNASVLVSELSAYLGQNLDPEQKYDSLAGMLTEKTGSVPTEGTTVMLQGLRFIVRASDEKHIESVEIVRGISQDDPLSSRRAAS